MSRFPNHSLRTGPDNLMPWVLAVIVISTIARLAFATGMDYGVDEAYALAVGHIFQWSFFDHPPLAFWTAGLMEWLAGDTTSHWLVRLPFILAFSGTLFLIYELGRRLFSPEAGLWGLIFLAVSPFFFASAGSWIVPDGPLDLFLAASAVQLAQILFSKNPGPNTLRSWAAFGVTFGLAALSKYHAFLFGLGVFLFIIATPKRRYLTTPGPWLAAFLALVLFLPVIIWNATQGWASLAFQSGRGRIAGHLDPVNVLQMTLGEAAYLWPWTMAIGIFVLARASFTKAPWLLNEETRVRAWFLISLSLPAILVFTFIPLFGSRGFPHWPMPGWLFVFPLIGTWIADLRSKGHNWPAWLAGTSACLLGGLAVTVVGLLRSSAVAAWLASTSGMLGAGGSLQPFYTEAADWQGLANALHQIGIELNDHRFLATFRWHNAARIETGFNNIRPIVVFDADARGFRYLVDQRDLIGEDAIAISEMLQGVDPQTRLKPFFQSVDKTEVLTIKIAGGIDKQLWVTVAHHFRGPAPVDGEAVPRGPSK